MSFEPLSEKTIEKIKNYWEDEISRRGYYNINKNVKIIEIFEMNDEEIPQSWVLGMTEDEFKLINIMDKASKILEFKLTEAFIPIIKVLKKIYADDEQLIHCLLSIILNYVYPYYFPQEFNRLQKFHHHLGIEG